MPAVESWSRIHSRARRRGGRITPWTRPTCVQVVCHVLTFYSIVSCAALLQPTWWTSGGLGPAVHLATFWLVFSATLALYLFVCYADTRYYEPVPAARSNGFEARRCEDCTPSITRLRVKHCQPCGRCVDGFDHHCRYLNVCIGRRTYGPWFVFVLGIFLLMASCCYGAIRGLGRAQEYRLGAWSPALFYVMVGAQAALSGLSSLFLISLMGQHLYFMHEGITTLEYVKDQAPGFPSLPPRGWREALEYNECWKCGEQLDTNECDDPGEVWYCSICQTDVGKAGVEFLTCEACENINVCPLCVQAAKDPSAQVVTYRVSSLRRRMESPQSVKAFRAHSYGSRISSFASQREPKVGRRTLSAVVAAVEGHTGEPVHRARKCICCPEPPEKLHADANEDSASGDSDSGSSNGGDA